jgi:5-formyltetrahydrofolate cyclo-ligase
MGRMSSAALPFRPRAGEDDVEHTEHLKEALRTAIRGSHSARSERRRQEAAEAIADVVAAIPAVAAAGCVAVYAARPGEPDTRPLLDRLSARGTRVLLPVLGTGLQRDWATYAGPDDLRQRAPGRPPEPSTPELGPAALADADVVVAPALAVDTSGARLGQGGGWYDRALEHARPGVSVIAVVYADEVYDAQDRPLPRLAHDRTVDAVATPEGVRWFRSPAAG